MNKKIDELRKQYVLDNNALTEALRKLNDGVLKKLINQKKKKGKQ